VEDEDKDYEDIFSGDIVEKANSTVVDTKTLEAEAKDDTNPNQNIDDTQQIIKKIFFKNFWTNQEQGFITFICNNMYFRLGSIYRNCFVINNLY
jgi:hypothetical protein